MIEIRPMTLAHLEEVYAIECGSFAIPWPKNDIRREIDDNPRAHYWTALDGPAVVGYAGMWHVVNEGHITNIAVKAERRRQGIGRMLLQKLIDQARELEMIGLTLEVRVHNRPAQLLYTQMGFKHEGFRKNYYADTHEDALIMWKYFDGGTTCE